MRFKEFLKDWGYEKTSELVGEIVATVSLFVLVFMIAVIGG